MRGAREHRDRELGDHAHVDRDPVALLHPERLERVGGAADVFQQLGVGDRPRVAGLAFPVERHLRAMTREHVPVDAVVGDVQLAAHEPLRERKVPLQRGFPRRVPVEELGRLTGPELDRIRRGGIVERRVGDERTRHKRGRGRERSALLEQRLERYVSHRIPLSRKNPEATRGSQRPFASVSTVCAPSPAGSVSAWASVIRLRPASATRSPAAAPASHAARPASTSCSIPRSASHCACVVSATSKPARRAGPADWLQHHVGGDVLRSRAAPADRHRARAPDRSAASRCLARRAPTRRLRSRGRRPRRDAASPRTHRAILRPPAAPAGATRPAHRCPRATRRVSRMPARAPRGTDLRRRRRRGPRANRRRCALRRRTARLSSSSFAITSPSNVSAGSSSSAATIGPLRSTGGRDLPRRRPVPTGRARTRTARR